MLWLIAIGGACGSVARVLVGRSLAAPVAGLPVGTFAVNVVGSFAIGLVLRWADALPGPREPWRALLAAGFCGGFTTFSTFSAETVALAERGDVVRAFAYAAFSMLACLAATLAGFSMMKRALTSG